MQRVPDFIVERQLALFHQIDPAYASGVRAGMAEKKPLPAATR